MAGIVQNWTTLFCVGILLLVGGELSVLAEEFRRQPTKAFGVFQAPLAQPLEHLDDYFGKFLKGTEHEKSSIPGKAFRTESGLGLRLLHRDEKVSPFRAIQASRNASEATIRKEENSFTASFKSAIQRDAARVRAIDAAVIGSVSGHTLSRSVVSNAANGEALESRVFSGLNLGSGEYFTSLSFGSPPTEVLVTIDTGSDLVWLQCHPCENCYDQLDPIFNPELSKSYATESCISNACEALPRSSCDDFNCQYTENYGDGSYSRGELATETVTVNSTSGGATEIPGVVFGCGHDNQGLFTASSGLLGLGRGRLSFPSQISQFVAPRFSYCLADRFLGTYDSADNVKGNESSNLTKGDSINGNVNAAIPEGCKTRPAISEKRGESNDSAGDRAGDATDGYDYDDGLQLTPSSYLVFGEVDGLGSELTYTELIRNPSSPSFYYLQLTGISVAEERLTLRPSVFELDVLSGRGGVILDTGTAITRLASEAYVSMRDAFRLKAKHLKRVVVPDQQLFDTCFRLFKGQLVPLVTLHFALGADLVLPPDNVVIPVEDSGSVYCLAFAATESRAEVTIIGNVQQQGFRFEFDLVKEKLGFTRQNCGISS